MLNLTDRAADKVKEIRDAEGLAGQGLRVRVIGGGCAGFSYDLFFEDETSDIDQTFESHGIPIYVDMMSAQYRRRHRDRLRRGPSGRRIQVREPPGQANLRLRL